MDQSHRDQDNATMSHATLENLIVNLSVRLGNATEHLKTLQNSLRDLQKQYWIKQDQNSNLARALSKSIGDRIYDSHRREALEFQNNDLRRKLKAIHATAKTLKDRVESGSRDSTLVDEILLQVEELRENDIHHQVRDSRQIRPGTKCHLNRSSTAPSP